MSRNTHETRARGGAGRAIGQLIRSRQRSVVGPAELAALGVAALLLAAALASYFLLLRPQRTRLASLQDEQGRLDRQLREARSRGEMGETAQASVERILASIQEFEGQHLSVNAADSTTAVIKQLNGLIHRHGLRISGGLTFTPFEPQAPGQGQGRQPRATGPVKPVQNIFPGIGVSVSVEGPYQGLRRFIRDVEADERFVVINAIELEGVTDTTARFFEAPGDPAAVPGDAPAPQQPSARGTLVALRLDMAAYFRRPGAVAAVSDAAPDATR